MMVEASTSGEVLMEQASASGAATAGELEEAQRLYDDGCEFSRNEAFDDAAECFSKALEIRVRHFGELAPECATTYYKYGCSLFDKLQDEADPLGETVNPANAVPSSNGEGSSGKAAVESEVTGKDPEEADGDGEEGDEEEGVGEGEEGKEEEEGDLEDAWKMLEFARVIHEKQGSFTIETVDIITKLADVNCFKENYESCYADYAKALEMLKNIVEPDSRILAELYFKIAIAHQLDLKPKEALSYCSNAVAVCEARVQRLKQELANAEAEAPGSSGAATSAEGKKPEPETNGRMKEVQKENGKDDEGNEEMEEKSGTESVVTEIKDIEELLVDLRDKEQELKEMAAAPSLVEALQAANPEAAANVKQLFSLAAGSQASGPGSSSSGAAVDGIKVSNGFDQPSLTNFTSSTAVVTDLGVVGRGVKRAEPVAVTGGSAPPSKKRSFDMLMNGSGNGETQVGFGDASSVKPTAGEGAT